MVERNLAKVEVASSNLVTRLAGQPHCRTTFRGVAQSGRALRSGRRGPRFKSGRPDLGEVANGSRPDLRPREARTRWPPKADARTVGSAEAEMSDPRMRLKRLSPRRARIAGGNRSSNPGAGVMISTPACVQEGSAGRPWSRRIIGIAPVSKTGAREGVWVRIPPAPLWPPRSGTWGLFLFSN